MNMNLYAFLWVIRTGEGTTGMNGYRTLFGGGLCNSFDDHPRIIVKRKMGNGNISSSAAGAYQFLAKTWDECKVALGLTDFSPCSQDKAVRFLISRRKALDDIIAGRLYTTIKKCNREWASLPASPYGQPTMTFQKALEIYTEAGGINVEAKP